MTPRFPDGFLWGAATAAHQIEGGNVNSSCWEDEWFIGSGFAEPSGDACDSYHRYGDDIALLASSGLNTYRFGVEWSRIEPEEGWFSRAALDHYRRMAGTCADHGITPILTYQHFTVPRWFARTGGWADPRTPDRFARYAEHVAAHLGDLVPWVCTINEANLMSSLVHVGMAPLGSDGAGIRPDHSGGAAVKAAVAAARELAGNRQPEGARSSGWPAWELEHMAAAHRKASEAIKAGPGSPKVGWTLALIDVQPVDGGEDRCGKAIAAAQLDWLDVSADDDFVGVQTYSRERMGANGLIARPSDRPTTQVGWEVYPDALEHTVRRAADRAGVPVVVTENGMATANDDDRIAYTRAALQGLARCIADGIDVRGYTHWTLLDNFEWISGFDPKFGLIAVDRETFARTPKPSLAWLGQVARSNGAAL